MKNAVTPASAHNRTPVTSTRCYGPPPVPESRIILGYQGVRIRVSRERDGRCGELASFCDQTSTEGRVEEQHTDGPGS